MRYASVLAGVLCVSGLLSAQSARVHVAAPIEMPAQVDSNSPTFWQNGQLVLLNSTGGNPSIRSSGNDQFHLGVPTAVRFNHINPWPAWIEATWVDPNGAIFAWYHQEHWGLCAGSRLAVPQIGAAVSFDGGNSFQDLGAVLQSGDPYSCAAQNGYIAGGHGDFSVILDRGHKFFYFLFTNYAGPTETQGVAIARMAYENRWAPAWTVWKYANGAWDSPGIGGTMTPIFPAQVNWQQANTDSMWGPSIHWNTFLKSYVVLLNHSCCTTGFPQEGIYVSFNAELSKPEKWTSPKKLLDDPGWYPQVIGGAPQGTDRRAGRVARLYIYGHSHLEIIFQKPEPQTQP